MPLLPSSQYETLTAMITPAIFLTANASLIISTSNRMARVVDRIRVLNELVDKMGRGATDFDYTAERLEHLRDQLCRLEWRNDRIRYALTTLYISFTTFLGTSLILAVDALLSNRLIALPIGLAVAGVGLLLFSSINLALEALQALQTNRLEIRFSRELFDRRLAEGRAKLAGGPDGNGRDAGVPAQR
jgi:Protein of unknown function (DUF2721)